MTAMNPFIVHVTHKYLATCRIGKFNNDPIVLDAFATLLVEEREKGSVPSIHLFLFVRI